MFREFRDFVLRGNVIELAVAVVIGAAFTALVQSVVDNLIKPVINTAGGNSINGLAFHIIGSNDATVVNIGAVLSAIISFVITAAVVFFVFVRPINRLASRYQKSPAEQPAKPADVALLEEIRDLLRDQAGTAGARDSR